MFSKKNYILILAFGLFASSCSNIDTTAPQATVKSGLSQSVTDVKNAVNALANASGYEVLATSNQDLSSVTVSNFVPALINTSPVAFTDSITMVDIAGTYSLQNVKYIKPSVYSFFNQDLKMPKDSMILFLPLAKFNHLNRLFNDTTAAYTKDIKVSVSDYQRYYNRTTGESSFRMASKVSKKGIKSGTYKISRSLIGAGDHLKTFTSNKEFDFISGHVAKYNAVFSDTAATATYTLTDGIKTIFQEQFWSTKLPTDKKFVEKLYAISLGSVTLVRKPKQSIDSVQIYLKNVLQTKAKITITKTVTFENDSTENGLTNGHRSIVVTFDDGTTANISSLTGSPTLNRLNILFSNLRKSYFSTYLVDQAAMNIYKVNKASK